MWHYNPHTGVRLFIVDYPERGWATNPLTPEQVKHLLATVSKLSLTVKFLMMGALTQKETYPKYYRRDGYLIAIKSAKKMYKIEPRGSNKNEGITIDHYITRKMVLKYYGSGQEVSAAVFKDLVVKLYQAYIEKIIS